MIYHYCRVSTKEQNLDRQTAALEQYKSADRVFMDKASGKNFEREQYLLMKSVVQPGDEVIIKELDRLGRNKEGIKEELAWFKQHGVTVRVLDVPTTLIDFQGQEWIGDMINNMLIEVLGAIAEQERKKIHQRMMEGYAAKKARGEWDEMGRKRVDVDEERFQKFREKQKDGQMTVSECCAELGISRQTWYNRVRESA